MLDPELITIMLFGKPHTFRVEDQIDKARKVSKLLEKEVARVSKQVAGKSTKITEQSILILAALNIANENYELKELHAMLKTTISEKSTDLVKLIDKTIPEFEGYKRKPNSVQPDR